MSRLKKLLKLEHKTDYSYIVSREQPLSYETEMLQKTLINFEYVNVDNNYQVIQFTSSISGEGKSSLISNLSYLLANKKKVLIIDLDLRKPKTHRIFSVANENGLNDYLLGNIELKNIINSSDLGVDYILSGTKTEAISNVLTSDKLKDLINNLRKEYDYIFIDSPPVLPVSDSLHIAKIVDGIIFVVAANFVSKKKVLEAFKTLLVTETKIIGSIITKDEKRRGSKSNYYYYYENK